MQIITIMPDFLSAYAWAKDAEDDTTYVGGNIAAGEDEFEFSDFKVSAALVRGFCTWVGRFERFCDDPAFDWDEFHRDGIALTRRLKAEIGDQARVVYAIPMEDRKNRKSVFTDRLEILADGSLKPIQVRNPWKSPR